MKKKFEFYVNLGCACSEIREVIEIEIPDRLDQLEESEFVESVYKDWVYEKIDGYFSEIN